VHGSESASGAAEQVKANEQLQCAPEDGRMLAELVFQALGRSREFHRQALPLEMSVPMINRYGVGMSYGPHYDRAFMLGRAAGRSGPTSPRRCSFRLPRTTTEVSSTSWRAGRTSW
jgi:predicted 2-oxoglutarate/Fe(II)-dependent dioxygenase YbiX